jgi:dipeptidase D
VTDPVLTALEPALLWQYFFALSRIPRGSRNEAAAADWVAEQGRILGCEVIRDPVGNVVLRKPATPGRENATGFVLQAHVDMVCEKNEGTDHDFDRDPIRLRRDGDLLRATGTTLGADNGIGVAAALAVLASTDVAHGPLEVLVTVDEESGLTGANAFAGGILRGGYFVNLDSEKEGTLTIGCAGGIDTLGTCRARWRAPPTGTRGFRLKVFGLRGGHSGIDINAGRGNAIRLLARILYRLQRDPGIAVGALQGGNKRNAIPREATAVIAADAARQAELEAAVARLEQESRQALGAFDPGLRVSLEPVALPARVIETGDARAIVSTLFSLAHGVVAMSPDIPGLVQTSTNLGVVDTRDDAVVVTLLHRSSIDSSKSALVDRVTAQLELGGFEVMHVGGYPGWKPEPGSDLVRRANQVHAEIFGNEMKIVAVHAGLECGLIRENYGSVEMASIGPNMLDVHTPDENVSISSVGRFYKLLVAILERV